jgi:hypothetical protein
VVRLRLSSVLKERLRREYELEEQAFRLSLRLQESVRLSFLWLSFGDLRLIVDARYIITIW